MGDPPKKIFQSGAPYGRTDQYGPYVLPRMRQRVLLPLVVPLLLLDFVQVITAIETVAGKFDGTTPLIDELPGAIPADVCKAIIDKANSIGWNNIADSIDAKEKGNHFSQDIYLKDRSVINNAELLNMVKPYLGKLGEFVRERKRRSRLSFGQQVCAFLEPNLVPLNFIVI